MGLITSLVKTALIAGGVIIAQRMWDRSQVANVYVQLDELQERVRANRNRVGTVRANVLVQSRELVAEAEKRITYVDSLNELRRTVEIYIESIPD